MFKGIKGFYRCLPIEGNPSQSRQKTTDQGEVEQLFFGDIIERKFIKGAGNKGYIRPVLMFGCNDGWTLRGNMVFTIDLKLIEAVAPAGDNRFHKVIEKTPPVGFRWNETDFHDLRHLAPQLISPEPTVNAFAQFKGEK